MTRRWSVLACGAILAAGACVPPPVGAPTVSIADATAVEGGEGLTFVASLSAATTTDVSFTVALGGSAQWIADYRTLPLGVVTIPAGSTTADIAVDVVDDDTNEPVETVTIEAGGISGATIGRGRATGLVYDDDNAGPEAFGLDVLHINDHHSHLQQESVTLSLPSGPVNFQLGGFPRVVSMLDRLEAELATSDANVVRIHAGDALSGTLYYTLFGGEADAALMNEACFDIFELGNHEFDGGDARLAEFLDDLAAGDCPPEVLAANIRPALGTPLAPEAADDYLQPYVVKEYDGRQVAFIGIDVAQKTKVSSSPLETTEFDDEAETLQRYIDQLSARGIRHIVGVTHQGYDKDLDIAARLRGIDVIVGGDSHSLLGDFDGVGLTSQGEYPTQVTDATGHAVCIAQAWQYSWVVGHLAVGFDQAGNVTSCGGRPTLLLGDVLTAGVDPATALAEATAATNGSVAQVDPDPQAELVLSDYATQVTALSERVIGSASAKICNARFPSDGRSTLCTRAELPQGGQAQQFVTDAFLARAFRADIALQNSGGVRIDLPPGPITIGDVYTLLPFANTIYEIDLSGAEIKLGLEQAIGNVVDAGGSTGAYPYGSGIRWDLDLNQPFGSRFTNLEVRPKGTADWVPLDPEGRYVVAANSFMATGGDGYTALRDAVRDGRGVDTFLDYAQTVVDYIEQDAAGVIGPPAEFSTKSFTPKA